MRDALAAALAGEAALVVVRDAGAVADVRAAAREAGVVLLLIDESVPKLDAAMLVAALGPLATECAPRTRIVAVQVIAGATQEDVVAAARFLAGATSATGQILRIGPR